MEAVEDKHISIGQGKPQDDLLQQQGGFLVGRDPGRQVVWKLFQLDGRAAADLKLAGLVDHNVSDDAGEEGAGVADRGAGLDGAEGGFLG